MATKLSTGATVVASRTVSSTLVTPSVNISAPNGGLLAVEWTVTVPNAGAISLWTEYSLDGGTTFLPLTIDGFTGGTPKTGNSSIGSRAFTRANLPSTNIFQLRARVPDVVGSWPVTVKAEIQ